MTQADSLDLSPLPPLAATDAATSIAGASSTDEESKCRRCGASCHVAVPAGPIGTLVVPGLHCMFLEPDAGRFHCSVYSERFERAPWCHTAVEAQPLGYLATDCPYGANADAKLMLPEEQLLPHWPTLLRNMRAWGVPTYIHQRALLAEVTKRTRRKWVLEPWPGDPERLRLRPVGFTQPYVVGNR